MKSKKYSSKQDDAVILEHLKKKDFNGLFDFCWERDMVQQYQEVIYLEKPYKIGDDITCSIEKKNFKKEQVFGKITDIATLLIQPTHLPVVKIQEYVDKHQLNLDSLQLTKHDFEGLGDFELFQVEKETWMFINDVDVKIEVMTLKEYEDNPDKDENQYFSRAKIQNGNLITDDEGWYKICTCQQLSNPDKAYVQCDKCEMWMHDTCAKIDIKNLKANNDEFLCPYCLPSAKEKQKKKKR